MSNDVTWIKIQISIFDHEKIRIIELMSEGDSLLIIWIKLLVQAGKTNSGGYIYLTESIPYTDETLSKLFNRPVTVVRQALETFRELEMIEIDQRGILIRNWERYQNIEGLEKIRESGRQRQQRHRDKQKQDQAVPGNGSRKDEQPRASENQKSEYSESFLKFWETYPKKRAKGEAYKIWGKLKCSETLEIILEAVEKHKLLDDWQKEKGQFIPYPGTWLKRKMWEDEPESRGGSDSSNERVHGPRKW